MSIEDAIKRRLSELPASMSQGQRALEALSLYRSARLPVPDAVLRTIDDCYRHFAEGKPVCGHVVEKGDLDAFTMSFPVGDVELESMRKEGETKVHGGSIGAKINPSPMTLGDAFGISDIKGGPEKAIKRNRLAMAQPLLVAMFTGQGTKKPLLSNEGFEEVAEKLGLTTAEVKEWVKKHISVPRVKT